MCAGSWPYYRLKWRWLSGLTAAHGLNDFNAVTFVQRMFRDYAFRHDGSVDFNRITLTFQSECADQHGQGCVGRDLPFFAIKIQFHGP